MSAHFGEGVIAIPGGYAINSKKEGIHPSFFPMLGIGAFYGGYPLYADAVNSKGLAGASLYFPGNAHYGKPAEGKHNVAPYELIPEILSRFSNLNEVRQYAREVNLIAEPFAVGLPLTDLHYIFADKTGAIIIEPREEGLRLFEPKVPLLTNNPPYEYQEDSLARLANLGPVYPESGKGVPDSVGFGAMGLPGDQSARSRYLRGAYLLQNAANGGEKDIKRDISSAFDFFGKLAFFKGEALDKDGKEEMTIYTSVYSLEEPALYYRKVGDYEIYRVDFGMVKKPLFNPF